jgi:hypothetical protein
MIDDVTVRRVHANEAAVYEEALADVLIDCVEGGASESFMLPISRDKGRRSGAKLPMASRAANAY